MKYHYKLEFDIYSNYEDIEEAIKKIKNAIMAGFAGTKKVIEIEVKANIVKVEVE